MSEWELVDQPRQPRYAPPPGLAPPVDGANSQHAGSQQPGSQTPPFGRTPAFVRALDRALAVQRPLVLAHIRSLRLRHPDATPDQLVRMLERRYLLAVTGGGAAVGATAVVPAIGTAATLALSGVETVGFLESTALFAQSVAELHGIPVENPDRARVLVMTLMLGQEGTDLLKQLAGQTAGRGVSRSAFWGEVVTKTLPRGAVRPILDRLQRKFIGHFAKSGTASVVGKALPFGIGAVIGGAGNGILASRVIKASRRAFGPAPAVLGPELAPKPGAMKIETRILRGAKTAGGSIAQGAGALGRGVKRVAKPKQKEIEAPAALEQDAT